jgi:hypothetical protein
MRLDLDRVRQNVQRATTEDLLDRATVYRPGMEPAALEIIDAELEERGFTARDVEDHARARNEKVLVMADGIAARCSFCFKPASSEGWGWHMFWGKVPLWPRYFRYCDDHRPSGADIT